MPGDAVSRHTDICHAVGDEHTGREDASVPDGVCAAGHPCLVIREIPD